MRGRHFFLTALLVVLSFVSGMTAGMVIYANKDNLYAFNALKVEVVRQKFLQNLGFHASEPFKNKVVVFDFKTKDGREYSFLSRTDADGKYRRTNLVPGLYKIVVGGLKSCQAELEITGERRLTSVIIHIFENDCRYSVTRFKGIPDSFYSK